MNKLLCLLGLLCFVAVCYAEHEEHRVHVTVYYESLCPDSRKFFIKQLYPSLQGNLSHFVNLTLLPYGKSTQQHTGNDYKFECNHGPDECMGNKIQACALKLIEQAKVTAGFGFNKHSLGFINCLMDRVSKDNGKTQFPTKDCAEINQVSNLYQIDNCAIHPDGSNYLANIGTLTQALKPPLTSVPTIVFNNAYKKEDTDLAQSNFVKALCQYIHDDKPYECLMSSSGKTQLSIFSVALILLAAFRSF